MDDNQRQRVRRIFMDVAELPEADRAEALARLCQGDDAVRAEVERLLSTFDRAGDFMARPTAPSPDPAGPTTLTPITERPGERIGPYKLLQAIGEGGFGSVFLAEQTEPVRRRVALKVIKLGMDTRSVVARFEAERQALALMDHPHIARVFDAGVTAAGRPYFVMEYVTGDAITAFATAHRLTIPDRLALFAQVCQAVQHAHHKGVIHRDLKPANVLVSMVDGRPFAKVIDFGIAKAIAAPLTDKTLFTEHRQLIGTPEYMSPEQAEGSPDIDTRADVYALGVLLYELLTGQTPFDARRLRSAAYAEMQRIIKEEEPPTPSVRVRRSLPEPATPGAEPDSPAATAVPSSYEDLKGELDWIVMKALDKDRGRRYDTPGSLAEDLQRHLRGEAVIAAPPRMVYRLRKYVGRHKAQTAIATTILIGSAGTTMGLAIAHYNARAALHNADLVKQARDELQVLANNLIRQRDITRDSMMQIGSIIDCGDCEDDGQALAEGFYAGWISSESAAPYLGDPDDELRLRALGALGVHQARELVRQSDAAEWSAYTANLALAQSAIEAGNYPEARLRLAACPTTKQGWEYQLLLRLATSADLAVPGDFQRAWVDPKNLYAVENRTGRIRAFDLDTGHEMPVPEDGQSNAERDAEVGSGWNHKVHPSDDRLRRLGLPLPMRWAGWMGYRESADGRSVIQLSDRGVQVVNEEQGTTFAMWSPGNYLGDAAVSRDGGRVVVWLNVGEGGANDARVIVARHESQGGPARHITDRVRLTLQAAIDQSNLGASGVRLSTPDGSRRIVASPDGTIRFSDRATDRELAVFRMNQPVTNLQMTSDGTRLIIHLADGSARIWDIRDLEERRKDLQAEWAERTPAGAYLDTLWAGDAPTDGLLDAIIADASLAPLRRLVAAEMLDGRLADLRWEADQAFGTLTEGKTERAEVLAAAQAADLPPRVKERVLVRAAAWEYEPPRATAEVRLAEESREHRLTKATMLQAQAGNLYVQQEDIDGAIAALRQAADIRRELLGAEHELTESALADMALFSRGPEAIDLRQQCIDIRTNRLGTDDLISLGYREQLMSELWYQGRTPEAAGAFRTLIDRCTGLPNPAFPGGVWAPADYAALLTLVQSEDGGHAVVSAYGSLPGANRGHAAIERIIAVSELHESRLPEAIESARAAVRGASRADPVPSLIISVASLLLAGDQPDSGDAGASLITQAQEALALARSIIADPNALKDDGIPWAQDPDARALLAEAEALIANTPARP